MTTQQKTPNPKGTRKKVAKKAPAKKAPAKKAATKPKPAAKGADTPAPRTRANKGSTTTKAARNLDKSLEDVLIKMDHPVALPVQVSHPRNCIHTGMFMLDLITCGGYRKGRMYTLLAKSGHGKSTLIQEAIAAAQLQGIRIFHFDMEHSSARQYMIRQGILLDDSYRLDDGSRGYYYLDPESGEEFYRMAGRLLRALPKDADPDKPPKTIVLVDSYEAFTSDAVTDTKEPIGVFARMHSMWQKKLRREIRRAGAVMVATNQLRTSGIGSFFVDEEDDAGGYALKFYSDCRVFIRMSAPKKELGGICKGSFRTKKNRMADPFKKAEDVRLILGRGYDRLHDRLMFLVITGQIKRDGAYYKIGDKKLQYKRTRELMRKPKYVDRCFEIAKRMVTYEKYFAYDGKVERWDETNG
jgi:recombination protein RecA